MRIGFIVNDVKTEEGKFTTSRLGPGGGESWSRSVGDGRRRLGLRSGRHDPCPRHLGAQTRDTAARRVTRRI